MNVACYSSGESCRQEPSSDVQVPVHSTASKAWAPGAVARWSSCQRSGGMRHMILSTSRQQCCDPGKRHLEEHNILCPRGEA